MSNNELALSLGNSISDDIHSIAVEAGEIGLDAILEDGVLKDIPVISTVVGLYKIGTSIKERHYVKKLYQFIQALNNGIATEKDREKYRSKIFGNPKDRNQEIEYLLILIDRYISYDKPQMLAKLYLAFLDEQIVWDEFSMYAEVIDRLFPLDFKTLITDGNEFITYRNIGAESLLRLVSLGLMAEDSKNSLFVDDGRGGMGITAGSISVVRSQERKYKRTEFGKKLATILRQYDICNVPTENESES